MKYFFDETQLAHQPTQYMVHGRIVDPFENPNRATTLMASLERAGLTRAQPKDYGRDPILAVHADHYVTFLEHVYAEFQKLPAAGPEVLPNVHPYRGASDDFGDRAPPRVRGIIGKAGWYMGDMSCATMEGTFRASYASAQTAIAAAEEILAGAKSAFALCRPPGHHAYRDRCSGFCYFNNAAIAADVLRRKFKRVAIIDFDTHHGDGTQAIFYHRNDVFYGSVHTDPSAYYPHFAGYADETGAGPGEGANLNLPLPWYASGRVFRDANEHLALWISAQEAKTEALVLSAGWDAHRDDPLSKLAVETEDYARIGELYGKLGLPTLIVQEGGYSLEAAAAASQAFMQAFRGAHS